MESTILKWYGVRYEPWEDKDLDESEKQDAWSQVSLDYHKLVERAIADKTKVSSESFRDSFGEKYNVNQEWGDELVNEIKFLQSIKHGPDRIWNLLNHYRNDPARLIDDFEFAQSDFRNYGNKKVILNEVDKAKAKLIKAKTFAELKNAMITLNDIYKKYAVWSNHLDLMAPVSKKQIEYEIDELAELKDNIVNELYVVYAKADYPYYGLYDQSVVPESHVAYEESLREKEEAEQESEQFYSELESEASYLSDMLKLAELLDKKGLYDEADRVEWMLKKITQSS